MPPLGKRNFRDLYVGCCQINYLEPRVTNTLLEKTVLMLHVIKQDTKIKPSLDSHQVLWFLAKVFRISKLPVNVHVIYPVCSCAFSQLELLQQLCPPSGEVMTAMAG